MKAFPLNTRKTIQVFILFISIIQYIFLDIFEPSSGYITFLQIQLISLYLISIREAEKLYGLLSLYHTFLITFGLFLLSRIVLDLFDLTIFNWGNKFQNLYFSEKTSSELLVILINSLNAIHLGAIESHKKISRNVKYDSTKVEFGLMKVSKILFLSSLPAILYKYLIQIKFILHNGYLSLYNGALKQLDYPLWTFGSGTLMELSFCTFLASKPRSRDFIRISILFLIIKTFDVLKGGRSKLFLPVLFILWYYQTQFRKKKIKSSRLIIIGGLGVILSQFLLMYRDDNNIILDNGSFFLTLFFNQQGVSLLVPGYLIHFKETFINETLPYILYPLTQIGSEPAQSVELAQNTLSLGHRLTYFLSPNAYLNGEGIGSSYIAELYDLGFTGVVIGSIILGRFIKKYHINLNSNVLNILFSYYIFQTIIYMPRASYFPMIGNIISLFIFFQILKKVFLRNYS